MTENETKPSAGVPVNAPLISNIPGLPAAGGIPNIYFNGFALSLTNADSNLVLMIDGQPLAKLAMSFTTAKTLMSFMSEMMEKLEGATGHKIMKTSEIEAGLTKLKTDEKS